MKRSSEGEVGGAVGRALRRLSHLALGAIIVVYLFPERIYGLPRGFYIVLFFTILPLTIEYFRIKRGVVFTGLREHEKSRVASYAWFCQGVVISILFFPQQIAAPAIVAAAAADPLMGEVRRLSRGSALLAGFLLSAAVFFLYGYSLPLSALSGALVVLGELLEVRGVVRLREEALGGEGAGLPFKTDDDFTTVLVPVVLLALLYHFLPNLFPGALLKPSAPFTSLP